MAKSAYTTVPKAVDMIFAENLALHEALVLVTPEQVYRLLLACVRKYAETEEKELHKRVLSKPNAFCKIKDASCSGHMLFIAMNPNGGDTRLMWYCYSATPAIWVNQKRFAESVKMKTVLAAFLASIKKDIMRFDKANPFVAQCLISMLGGW